jgi:conjugal transfer pilus assembly protein TraW
MSKSWVEHILYSKVLAGITLCFSASVLAEPLPNSALSSEDYRLVEETSTLPQSSLTEEDFLLIEKSEAIQKEAQAAGMPDWLKMDTERFENANQEARELVTQLQETDPTMKKMADLEKAKARFSDHKIVVFASRSLGREGLNSLLDAASYNNNVLVVFRGIPEGMNLGEGVMEVQTMAAERSPVPNIVINPVLFDEYNITVSPTIIVRKEQSTMAGQLPEEIARVTGLSDAKWLLEQIESGQSGDFGVKGPVADISEPDLIEVMKQRVAKIDWDAKKQAAKDNFWKKQTFRELPKATEDRTREIDPTLYIAEDIKAPDGTVIAKQGDLINPLDVTPFTQAVVIFDPLDANQLSRIRAELPRIKQVPGVQRITYIVTRLERESGWDSYTRVTDELDAPVFLLTPDLMERFEIQRVPSVITANKSMFVIEEFGTKNAE